jgi:hypothetical protein
MQNFELQEADVNFPANHKLDGLPWRKLSQAMKLKKVKFKFK